MLVLIVIVAVCVWFAWTVVHTADPKHHRGACRSCRWLDRTRDMDRRRSAARRSARDARRPGRAARRAARERRRHDRKYPALVQSPYPGLGKVRAGSIPDPLLYAHHLRGRGWPEDEIAAACARVRADRRRASRHWPFLRPPSGGV